MNGADRVEQAWDDWAARLADTVGHDMGKYGGRASLESAVEDLLRVRRSFPQELVSVAHHEDEKQIQIVVSQLGVKSTWTLNDISWKDSESAWRLSGASGGVHMTAWSWPNLGSSGARWAGPVTIRGSGGSLVEAVTNMAQQMCARLMWEGGEQCE